MLYIHIIIHSYLLALCLMHRMTITATSITRMTNSTAATVLIAVIVARSVIRWTEKRGTRANQDGRKLAELRPISAVYYSCVHFCEFSE